MMKDLRGCTEPICEIVFEIPLDEHGKNVLEFYECPQKFLTPKIGKVISLIRMVQNYGILPYPGAWLNQPVWFVQAFHLFTHQEQIIRDFTHNRVSSIQSKSGQSKRGRS